jgi:hypothetical protein
VRAAANSIIAFAVGAGAFGLLLGSWIALSASPVITTVLPLIFGVVTGAGGAQLFRFDSDSPAGRSRLSLFGISAATFSFFCLLGMLGAVALRSQINNWLIPQAQHADILNLDPPSPLHGNPFGALLLRARLEAIKASPEEIKTIFNQKDTSVVPVFPAGEINLLDKLITVLKPASSIPTQSDYPFKAEEPR